MSGVIAFEEKVEVPMTITSLATFREWTRAADFPEHGRIDFVRGRVEVDRSGED